MVPIDEHLSAVPPADHTSEAARAARTEVHAPIDPCPVRLEALLPKANCMITMAMDSRIVARSARDSRKRNTFITLNRQPSLSTSRKDSYSIGPRIVAGGTGDEKRVARPTGDTFFIVRTGRGIASSMRHTRRLKQLRHILHQPSQETIWRNFENATCVLNRAAAFL